MEKVTKETLRRVIAQLAAYPWRDEEVDELVAPRMGIITGFQDLLADLEALRQRDLGATPPAQGPRKDPASE